MSTRNHQIYAELTPNPNSVKFVADRILLFEGAVEYKSKAEAADCPIASQLFDFTGVKGVFITSNFITITKENDIDWYEITNILREFIKGFLNSGEKLFLKNPVMSSEVSHPSSHETVAPDNRSTLDSSKAAEHPAIEEKIKTMLDEYVRPAVEGDGGAIDFKSFQNGIVTVVLKGSCSGCPSSTLTLKAGIENLLKRMIPEVSEVMAEQG
jgi:Fe-S cluster biogenesis protein NfuA